MKRYLWLFCTFLIISCTTQEKSVRIFGTLNRLNSPMQTILRYNGSASNISDYRDIQLNVKKDGTFEAIFELDIPGYYYINRNPLYLSPGDNLEVDISEKSEESIFLGKGAEANNYLKKRFYSKGGSFLQSGRFAYNDANKMITAVDSQAMERREELKKLSGVTKEFKRLEEARIDGDIVNSYAYYTSYCRSLFPPSASPNERREIQKQFYDSVSERLKPLLNGLAQSDDYIEIEVVRQVLNSFSRNPSLQPELSPVAKELFVVSGEAYKIKADLTSEDYERFVTYAEGITDSEMKIAFLAKLEHFSVLLPGKSAIDVLLEDTQGNKKRLSDFKGTPIYIDVWATWCGPCIQEAPFFKELSQEYQDILFISISVDNDKKGWQNYVSHKESGSVLEFLATEASFRPSWGIGGIPHFILIDRDFKIVNANAPRPSEEEKIKEIFSAFDK